VKLLFDQNLSHYLVELLAKPFPGSVHVRDVGLKDATDIEIWEYAKANGFVIVSKDSDFRQRSFLFGQPPKVIWVRLGNCSTSEIETTLRSRCAAVQAFFEDAEAAFMVLSK
jgi:predicted nuclease of predicted toxin-antitoxin system